MGKNIENVADTGSSKQARFHKLFGDASEMYLPASPETMSSLRREGMDFQTFVLPREYPVVSDNFLPEAKIRYSIFSNRDGKKFIALASWDEQELHLQLTDRNWQIETISDFQKATDGQIIIPPGKGVIITSKK